MLLIGLLTIILAIAISSERITTILFNRVITILLLYSGILSFNTLYVSTISSGIGVFGGLFHVSSISQSFDSFLFLVGAMILQLTGFYAYSTVNKTKPNVLKSKEGINTTAEVNSEKLKVEKNEEYKEYSMNKGLQSEQASIAEYPLIILFAVMGATFLISSSDLVSMYLSIELQSYALYILATIYRDSQLATSAGLKYFLLGGLSSGFLLLGSSLLYAYTGITNLEGIYIISSLTESSKYIQIGILIIAVGFLFKIAAAPFHNWAPDVYDGVPTIVTTWLTVMTKISILIFLLEFVHYSSNSFFNTSTVPFNLISMEDEKNVSIISLLGLSKNQDIISFNGLDIWTNLLLVSSLLSLLIGTIVGLAQYRIKRLLAYSTISHIGFMLLALAINTEESIESFIFYLIQYSLSSANAFFILIAFGYIIWSNRNLINFNSKNYEIVNEKKYSPIQLISQLRGQFYENPYLALSLAITLFSFAGK